MCDEHVQIAKREKNAGGFKDPAKSTSRPTLFRHLVNSDLPASEISDDRMSKEAQVLIGSGTLTTAGTMCFLIYHIMANPAVKKRLEEELGPVMEGYPAKKPTWAEIEKVEYLQAVLKEGLR